MSYSNPGTDGSDQAAFSGSKGRPFVSQAVVQGLGLNGQNATGNRYARDPAGFVWTYPTVLGSLGANGQFVFATVGGPSLVNNFSGASAVSTLSETALANVVAAGGVDKFTLELQQTPTIWKDSGALTAANGTIWTPGAGNRYRLMGFSYSLSKDATSAVGFNPVIQDSGGTVLCGLSVTTAALAASTSGPVFYRVSFPFNGFLSPTPGNTLQVVNGTALTAGTYRITAWGTEN